MHEELSQNSQTRSGNNTFTRHKKKTQEFELIVLFVILLQLINNARNLSLPSTISIKQIR